MSFDFNYKFWVATKKDLEDLIKRQNVLKKKKPISNPRITYRIFTELYVLYVDLVQKLGYLYHKTYQVQKREVVRALAEPATRRLLELKDELKNLELSEYVYTDKALIARKLTPNDLVIWRFPHFLYRRPPDIQNIMYDNKIFMDEDQEIKEKEDEKMKLRESVIIIQSHERARRNRVYKAAIKYDKKNLKVMHQKKFSYAFTHKAEELMSIPVKRTVFKANFVKLNEECKDLLETDNFGRKSIDEIELAKLNAIRDNAASIIQRTWRAYRNRKILKKKHIFKETLLGMRTKRRLVKPNERRNLVIETYKDEAFKKKLDDDFYKLMMDERTRLLQERSPWIMEDISDHIRAWFKEFYDKTNNFHPYPEEAKQGTVLVLLDETMTPLEFQEHMDKMNLSKEEKKKLAEKEKQRKLKEKEKRKKDKLKEAKRRKKMKDAGIYDIAYEMQTNKNMEMMEHTIKQYSIDWRAIDEYLNKNHEPIKEWVTESELAQIHKELRLLVDEYMRLEFELLQKARCADLKQKYKPPKKKKPKGKKGKKRKKTKDMTGDRSLESLYNELKEAGIIEPYAADTFDKFIGDFNFCADDLRDDDNLTTLAATKGDIKMAIQDFMLGMGDFTVNKPKSLCLAGSTNDGKRLLCNIIASELDAVFMVLSPEKTYPFSDKLNYLINIVMKVAKAFQPTIIFLEDVHRIFWKKVPKDQEYLNPRLLMNVLAKKVLKPIKKDEKIMLVGTTDAPWTAKPKMKRLFQKVLLLPKNDYGTSFLLWLELLAQNAGDNCVDDYVISAMAKALQNYTCGDVCDNMADTLNVRRRMRLDSVPLNPNEFLQFFFDRPAPIFPPDVKIMEKYDKWYQKANKLCVARKKFKAKMARFAKKK